MPMQRWMQSAAGGTSQRLKPACAMMRSRSRIPGPRPRMAPACSMVAMDVPLSHFCCFGPLTGLFLSRLVCSLPQLLDCTAHRRIKPGAAGFEMLEDLRAHARIPEFLDVIGDARHRLLFALADEKL